MVDLLTKTYLRIKQTLEKHDFCVFDANPISYGIQFGVSKNAWQGMIRVYQNKKGGVKIDFSALHSENYTKQINSLLGEHPVVKHTGNSLIVEDKIFPVIGTDESGKGDYFGPLVAAGVYVDNQTAPKLRDIGVRDSKDLSDKENLRLSSLVVDICKNSWSIIEISPEKYNLLYKTFISERKNLNVLLAWGHAKAIEELLTKVNCTLAIADQFADEKYIIGKLQERGKQLKLIQKHKAEAHVAVAAASILARARFLEKISKLSAEYKMEFHKGASDSVIADARTFVSKHGMDSLAKVAKLHFKTTQEVIKQ